MTERRIPRAKRALGHGKRALDLALAIVAIVAALPCLLVAAVGIRLSSPGPVLYRARRIGLGGAPFTMFKFRTMHHAPAIAGPVITRGHDARIFPFGRLLRQTKLDELPQLFNIVRGEMSFVGPRPEDPTIVSRHYIATGRETLRVRPGLTSPGTLFHDRYCGPLLESADIERVYAERILPIKLALDLLYLRDWSLLYDLRLIVRTIGQVLVAVVGWTRQPDLPELVRARTEHLLPRYARGFPSRFAAPLLLLAFQLACTDGSVPAVVPLEAWVRDTSETILVGAGDIADCSHEIDEATAELLDSIPGTIFTTGDNVYPHGTATEFIECYGPTWGRHRERTRPAPGNHEYETPNATGYFRYFGAAAGEAPGGYYSYRLGAWHVVALNSQVPLDRGSAQLRWLSQDLAASNAPCAVVYMHRPRFNSGSVHGNDEALRALWDVLDSAGVELVLAGHEHLYERFAPMAADGTVDTLQGVRQFTVGTGGARRHRFAMPVPNSEVRERRANGVLALRLQPDAFEWRFVSTSAMPFADQGRGRCHGRRFASTIAASDSTTTRHAVGDAR